MFSLTPWLSLLLPLFASRLQDDGCPATPADGEDGDDSADDVAISLSTGSSTRQGAAVQQTVAKPKLAPLETEASNAKPAVAPAVAAAAVGASAVAAAGAVAIADDDVEDEFGLDEDDDDLIR